MLYLYMCIYINARKASRYEKTLCAAAAAAEKGSSKLEFSALVVQRASDLFAWFSFFAAPT